MSHGGVEQRDYKNKNRQQQHYGHIRIDSSSPNVLIEEREDKSTTRVDGATTRAFAAPRRELYSQLPRFDTHD